MLQITNQIKTAIIKGGFQLCPTLEELNEAAKEFNQEINCIDIYRINDKEASVYFINKKESNYNYLNNERKRVKAYSENNPKKWVYTLLLNQLEDKKSEFLKEGKPLSGYTIKELPNNKPLTLLNAKNKNFISFIVVSWKFYSNGASRINEIDITEEKKEFRKDFLKLTDNCWDSHEVRKAASHVFAVYNTQKEQSDKEREIIANKRKERRENADTLTGWERYNPQTLDDYKVRDLITTKNRCLCSKLGYFHPHDGDLDKSGYLLRYVKIKLTQRAEELKRRREQERRERITKEWITTDHTKQKNEINRYLLNLACLINVRCTLDNVTDGAIFEELKTFRDLYISFKKQLNFNNYKNVDEWNKCKAEKVEKYNFFTVALVRGVFSRLACFHQYEKTATGYTMREKEKKDPFWGDSSRYVQEF